MQKKWKINDNVITLLDGNLRIIPSVEEMYSSVFEGVFSTTVSSEDVRYLSELLEFSKYPAQVLLVIETVENKYIEANIYAKDISGARSKVDLRQNNGHIIIDNVWYPLEMDEIEEISTCLSSCEIKSPGKISLKQFLCLQKTTALHLNIELSPTLIQLDQEGDDREPNIKASLYPYQKNGWKWLRFIHNEKLGCLLADEMGLGKTIQIVALLASELPKNIFPSLIICPSTLLENWCREFKKFAPHIRTSIHQGQNRTGFPAELLEHDVVITSYDTVLRDVPLFRQVKWKVVVCDEAQAIKNPATRRANAVKSVPREMGIAVTGTPIENTLTDLWSVMDFALPDFLGKLEDFEATYGNTNEQLSHLEQVVSPLILRRRVKEVAKDLPAKIIIPQILQLSEGEIEAYEKIREDTIVEFERNSSLVVLTRLRLFCAHPSLLDNKLPDDPSVGSNKYSRLIEIAEEIFSNGAKTIVFTSFNKMNDIIVTDFRKRFGVPTFSIDGRTPVTSRQDLVDEFSHFNGPAVMVLNPIAAGTGLNITAANHVIHYNLEWNPAKEDQASARAHRRGQDRPVTIHRLYYLNTVEEAINERLTRKRNLAEMAVVGVKGDVDDYNDILNAINKSPKLT